MISFRSSNLRSFPLFLKLQNTINLFDPPTFRRYWDLYGSYCKKFKRTTGNIYFREEEGAINVIGVKRDPEVSFNLGDAFYNDILIISQNFINALGKKDLDFYIYKVTMDPKDKSDKIAHLLLQMSNSYVIRPHRWVPSRIAICQDKDSVIIARTDSRGNVINTTPYNGFFGINIHDSGKWVNSSIGCTVLEKDSPDNGFHYKESFKPLLQTVTNTKDIVYAVSCISALENLYTMETKGVVDKELKVSQSFKVLEVNYSPLFMQKRTLNWWWRK